MQVKEFKLLNGKTLYIDPSEINYIIFSRNTVYLHSCKNSFSLEGEFESFGNLGFFGIENYRINLPQIGGIEEKDGYFLIYFKKDFKNKINVMRVDSNEILTAWKAWKACPN